MKKFSFHPTCKTIFSTFALRILRFSTTAIHARWNFERVSKIDRKVNFRRRDVSCWDSGIRVDVRGGRVHNFGFSVRVKTVRVWGSSREPARYRAVYRDLWTSIRGLRVTYLTDHNYILLLEILAPSTSTSAHTLSPPPSADVLRGPPDLPTSSRPSSNDSIACSALLNRSKHKSSLEICILDN